MWGNRAGLQDPPYGPPLDLSSPASHCLPPSAGEQLVYGDSKGHVVMLLCGTREWPARDLISTEEHQDYIYIHQDHNDWVSQVRESREGVTWQGRHGCRATAVGTRG